MAKKIPYKFIFETEYRVVGVFCREKDYRFCWLVNQYLKLDFVRTLDFEYFLAQNPGQMQQFSVYRYAKEELQQTLFLFNNHSFDSSALFTSPPGLDFLMLIKADAIRFDFKELLKKLRAIPQVTAAYLLDDALGKSKDAFLYDFEMYVAQELKM